MYEHYKSEMVIAKWVDHGADALGQRNRHVQGAERGTEGGLRPEAAQGLRARSGGTAVLGGARTAMGGAGKQR